MSKFVFRVEVKAGLYQQEFYVGCKEMDEAIERAERAATKETNSTPKAIVIERLGPLL